MLVYDVRMVLYDFAWVRNGCVVGLLFVCFVVGMLVVRSRCGTVPDLMCMQS